MHHSVSERTTVRQVKGTRRNNQAKKQRHNCTSATDESSKSGNQIETKEKMWELRKSEDDEELRGVPVTAERARNAGSGRSAQRYFRMGDGSRGLPAAPELFPLLLPLACLLDVDGRGCIVPGMSGGAADILLLPLMRLP